jgi:hypothetical protein
MDRLRPWLRFGSLIALAWCAIKACWWVFIAFVAPDDACYNSSLLDYAITLFAIYTALLAVLVTRFYGSQRKPLLLFCLCLLGVLASFLVWDLPESRARCTPDPRPAGATR